MIKIGNGANVNPFQLSDMSSDLALGLQFLRERDPGLAELHLERVVKVDPRNAVAWNALGIAVAAQQKLDHAQVCFLKAIDAAPDNIEFQNNLGNAYREAGKWQEAAACFLKTLERDPQNRLALYQLMRICLARGQPNVAHMLARRLLPLSGDNPSRLCELGSLLSEWNDHALAIEAFQSAAEQLKEPVRAYAGLGVSLAKIGRYAEAVQAYSRAIEIGPPNSATLSNLGQAYVELQQAQVAEDCLINAIRLDAANANAYYILGTLYEKQSRSDDAIACYEKAVAIAPTFWEAANNLYMLHVERRQFDQAIDSLQRALQQMPAEPKTLRNLAMLHLLVGDWASGWEYYEARWQCPDGQPYAFQEPIWDGQSLENKTILLHAEQGMGDAIQFVRFAVVAKEFGAEVIVRCQSALVPLFRSCPGVDICIAETASSLPAFDVHAPLMSCPRIMGITPDNVPDPSPYLFPDAGRVERWKQRFEGDSFLKIGLVWRGNPKLQYDQKRSIPLLAFDELVHMPGVTWYSLQIGPGQQELSEIGWGHRLVDLGSEFQEQDGAFLDTAAAMKNLDLVISIDSAPAHLAGALGVPVWLLLPHSADWRWMLDRETTPWYKSMRILRQPQAGDWKSVLGRVADELPRLLGD